MQHSATICARPGQFHFSIQRCAKLHGERSAGISVFSRGHQPRLKFQNGKNTRRSRPADWRSEVEGYSIQRSEEVKRRGPEVGRSECGERPFAFRLLYR